MMKTLQEFLEEQISEELILAVLSGSRKKEIPSRVRIRPVELKGRILYQASSTVGTKVFHENYTRKELLAYMEQALAGDYSQLQVQGSSTDGSVLVSKKGKQTIKVKPHAVKKPAKILSHNRVKQYILPRLSRDREITIVDFGCGKSYLTFAMYYFLRELRGYDVNIIGLDLKADVIENCSRLAESYGYDKLHFCQGDIAGYEGLQKVDMVVTLHACDKATDYALAKAVEWDAEVIFSVPCCQHELNSKISSELLEPVLKYGILKERMSALITDGIRANLLESKGYSTQILEFIDMEHTPKNLLIRAVKSGKEQSTDKLKKMTEALNGELTLEQLLYPRDNEKGAV